MEPSPGSPPRPPRPPRPPAKDEEGRPPSRPADGPDPLAAGLANASLLGAGYVMLQRRGLALGAAGGSLVLVGFLLASPSRWREVLVLLWWLAGTVHGWYLAGGRPRRDAWKSPAGDGGWRTGVRRQRLLALTVAGPLLLGFAIVRVDASLVEGDAATAHRDGDCARALERLDQLGVYHRLFDAPLTARSDDERAACQLLVEAERLDEDDELVEAAQTFTAYAAHPGALWEGARERGADLYLTRSDRDLDLALTGQLSSLDSGFDHLGTVLGEFPERAADVDAVVDDFLGALPVEDACTTRAIVGWLDQREHDGTTLDRAAAVVPELEPTAFVDCAEQRLAREEWSQARDEYERLVSRYPDHELVPEAEDGIERADTALELEEVRALLGDPGYPGGEPEYCANPAPYRGAPAYDGGGPHPALVFGDQEGTVGQLPGSWRAAGPEDAVLVVCLGTPEMGDAVETCPYESDLGLSGYTDVTFREMRVPLRAYELRTGEQVSDGALEIGGASCPAVLTYETFTDFDIPPSEVYVESSESDVRAAYRSLIDP